VDSGFIQIPNSPHSIVEHQVNVWQRTEIAGIFLEATAMMVYS
jgi:hypothetical protein